MQKNNKANPSFITPMPLSGASKSLAVNTRPATVNTPNSSGKSARMDSFTQPATQGNKTKRETRVQTDLVRQPQQIPYKTEIEMKNKDDKRKPKFTHRKKEYGISNTPGGSNFSYDATEMFVEYNKRKPETDVYAIKKVTRANRDLSVNLSTVVLPPDFPNDINADKATAKKESAMWLAFSEVFNEIRSFAYKNKRNDSFTFLNKRNLWDYWFVLSLGVSLYTTLITFINGAVRNPGNWSLEQISLTLNANAELLRWVDVLGQVLHDRVLPRKYTSAIAWHNTPKYAHNCPNSNMILTLSDAMMLPKANSDTWNDEDGWVNSALIPAIKALVDSLRDDDVFNRVDSLLRSCCTDRINLSDLAGVSNDYDPAFTEMFANDTIRVSELTGARMYPVLADANNSKSISYYIADSVKSPTFGAYFNTAVVNEQSGNAASGESATWFRRMVYLNSSESDANKDYETNVFNSNVATNGSFFWSPRNTIVDNMLTPSCHIATLYPDSNAVNQKFVSVPKPGMQAVDYFTPDFQFNSFSTFIKTMLSLNIEG
jgi:hypothetical protein